MIFQSNNILHYFLKLYYDTESDKLSSKHIV